MESEARPLKSEKTCTQCGVTKPISEFSVQRRADRPGTYYKANCKPCHSAKVSRFQKENPERWRNRHYKREYGIDLNTYNTMLTTQNNQCKICGRSDSQVGHNLKVDHCHVTGSVRGLLCSDCNLAIGLFHEKPETIESALRYLEINL